MLTTAELLPVGCRTGANDPSLVVGHRRACQEYVDLGKQPVTG
ncbi:MAG: hypothetical protein ACT4OL_10440 [Nitrospiraceae bacterium]